MNQQYQKIASYFKSHHEIALSNDEIENIVQLVNNVQPTTLQIDATVYVIQSSLPQRIKNAVTNNCVGWSVEHLYANAHRVRNLGPKSVAALREYIEDHPPA